MHSTSNCTSKLVCIHGLAFTLNCHAAGGSDLRTRRPGSHVEVSNSATISAPMSAPNSGAESGAESAPIRRRFRCRNRRRFRRLMFLHFNFCGRHRPAGAGAPKPPSQAPAPAGLQRRPQKLKKIKAENLGFRRKPRLQAKISASGENLLQAKISDFHESFGFSRKSRISAKILDFVAHLGNSFWLGVFWDRPSYVCT